MNLINLMMKCSDSNVAMQCLWGSGNDGQWWQRWRKKKIIYVQGSESFQTSFIYYKTARYRYIAFLSIFYQYLQKFGLAFRIAAYVFFSPNLDLGTQKWSWGSEIIFSSWMLLKSSVDPNQIVPTTVDGRFYFIMYCICVISLNRLLLSKHFLVCQSCDALCSPVKSSALV